MLQEMDSFILKDLQICIRDKFDLRVHCVFSGYVADLPETKDLTAVSNGSRSKCNCHISLAETGRFSITTNEVLKIYSEMSLQSKEVQRIRDLYKQANVLKQQKKASEFRRNAEKILLMYSEKP